MAPHSPKYLPIRLGLLFAVSTALTFFVMFKAGCAGDTKGGSLGDPVRALELEGVALFPLLVSVASGGATLGMASQSIHRVAHGTGFALLALICLWFASMQFEIWGVQSCFQP
jgi:hypothetical protein